MTQHLNSIGRLCGVLLLGIGLALPGQRAEAAHDIRGITGPNFQLYAYPFYISLPDGTSLYMWGFGNLTGGGATPPEAGGASYYLPQYPAPTLIVTEGEPVTITLTNYGVPDPVSIVVAGHNVTARRRRRTGLVTQAASNVGARPVTYSFTAGKPGTYVYHSLDGQNPGLHQEMGLAGALIVRPQDGSRTAYGANTGSDYDQEFLYLLTEVDPEIHAQMERGHKAHFTYSDRYATIWFVNGRVFPDLFQGDYNPLFPNQPYESLAQAHPGDKVLVRAVNVGQDSHPFHFHGENLRFIGRDGRMLTSGNGTADLGRTDNTLNSAPKQTVDMIWTWTGKDLNWDIYGPVEHRLHGCRQRHGGRRQPRCDVSRRHLHRQRRRRLRRRQPRVLRGPRQATPGQPARRRRPHPRRLVERQPLPRRHRRPAPRRGWSEPVRRLLPGLALPCREGADHLQHLPRRDPERGRRAAALCGHPVRAEGTT